METALDESADAVSGDDLAPRVRTRPFPFSTPVTPGAEATPGATPGEGTLDREPTLETPPPPWTTPPPSGSSPPARGSVGPSHVPNALPWLTRGIASAAAVWVGLAVFLLAMVYAMPWGTRAILMVVGGWMFAAGAAYAVTTRPEAAS